MTSPPPPAASDTIFVCCWLFQSPIWLWPSGGMSLAEALPACAGPENRLYLTAAQSVVLVSKTRCRALVPRPLGTNGRCSTSLGGSRTSTGRETAASNQRFGWTRPPPGSLRSPANYPKSIVSLNSLPRMTCQVALASLLAKALKALGTLLRLFLRSYQPSICG